MSHRVGRTRWRRFAAVLVTGVAASAVLGIAMGEGALAASFLISGQTFQITADTMTIRGYSTYSMVDVTAEHELVPVTVTGARHATIDNLCQSIVVAIPVLGDYTLKLTGGKERPVEATNLFIDATTETAAQANFRNIEIGVAQGAITDGPVSPGDRKSRYFDPNGIGQQATSVVLTDVDVTAVATSAVTFNIPGLSAVLKQGSHECS